MLKLFQCTKQLYLKSSYRQLKQAFSISSHLTIEERIILYKLSRTGKTIAEIGSYLGASACCFGMALKENGLGEVFCIDTWNNDSMSEGERDTWQDFQTNTCAYRDYIIPIRGFSNDVVENLHKRVSHLDLLFIDGDHSYESVKADWLAYQRFLTSGSIVVFHDYGWAEGVQRVVHEEVLPLVNCHNRLPNMWWGTIGTKP